MTVLYVLLALLLLAILIVVHELGHFMAARLMKIDVREFAVGFGKKLVGWKSKKHDTTFAIRAFPLGGYCAFYGEDEPGKIDRSDPRIFGNHPVWKRLIVIFSGPFMNFVLAFVVGVFFFLIGGVQETVGLVPRISDVTAAGPAYEAGLLAGDVVTAVNGESLEYSTRVGDELTEFPSTVLVNRIGSWKQGDAPLKLEILRGEEKLETELTPIWDDAEQKMRVGVMVSMLQRTEPLRIGLWDSVLQSWESCKYASGAILGTLGQLFTSAEVRDSLSGPVGIVSIVTTQVETGGLGAYTELLIIISINLGLMNLLPIPGLDGSRLIFGIVEAIRRKPVKPELEAKIHLIGLALLMGLMLVLTFKDVGNLFR